MTDEPNGSGLRPRAASGGDGRVLLVGARRHLRRLSRCLDQGPWSSLPVVGFVDISGRGRQLAVHPKSDPVPILGQLDHLVKIVDRSRATHVVVALSGRRADRLGTQIAHLSQSAIKVHWVLQEPTVVEPAGGGGVPGPHFGFAPRATGPWRWERFAKRACDLILASVGLMLLTPLFLAVSVLILVTSGWPIFYSQERVGQGGRTFRIIKFRSMRRDAETQTGPIWARDHDDRCTRIGDWLRHTNIDELPQLINIVRGEMSLVGPRPERPIFVDRFRGEVPDYDLRHAVQAGMTGWAQVHGWRGRTSLRKRIQFDLDYIRRWSFWLDFRILLMTIQHVAFGKTTWTGAKRRPS